MSVLLRLPLFVLLVGVTALAMMVPAIYASVTDHHAIARHFFYSGIALGVFSLLVGLASATRPRQRVAGQGRRMLLTMLAAVALLPLAMALPLAEALPDTGLFNAWWEMVSCFTTTGASLYAADLLAPPLHLWRAMVGWLGGAFMLTAAIAILAPLNLGGFEITSPPGVAGATGTGRPDASGGQLAIKALPVDDSHFAQSVLDDPRYRVLRYFRLIFPIYALLTLLLWILLLMVGDTALVALCRAMGTLSTSGIAPVEGPVGQTTGVLGEAIVFLFLILALSRRFWPGGGELNATWRWRDDPELRAAAAIVLLVAIMLFARHFIGAIEIAEASGQGTVGALGNGLQRAAVAAWGGLFNGLSFLTTTGWNSVDWQGARNWSGLTSPGVMLTGLAIMGGGIATTAGGVKLMRVFALALQSRREMEHIVHPSAVSGGGRMARRLRREGAYLAFIFFMLFALSIATTVILVSIYQIEFESATILSVAALTNTGPLAGTIALTPSFDATAGVASAPWEGWSGLAPFVKAVLAGAMIVGRLEILAFLALFTPDFWRS